MHIVRWLMGHPIVSAWILAVLAILLNWGVGGRSHEGMEHQAGQASEQHQVADAGHEGAEQAAATEEVAAAGHAAEQAAPAAEGSAAQVASTEAAPEQQAATSAGGGEGRAVAAVAVAATAASASVAEQAANNGTQAAEASQTAEQATTTDQGGNTPENLLLAAREAYWSGELDRSVEFYQSLLTKDNKPDYKGELANVYWKQGNSVEAVALYAEIAPWLAEQGRVAELNSIKVYADLVDAAKGAEIGALIK